MAPFTALQVVGGLAIVFSKISAGRAEKKAHVYRASLAEENAKRAELVSLEAEYKATNEGLLDAGLFRMRATQSGLTGVSKDLWVGQRYMDVYRDVANARLTKEQTVSRFLKEAGWHRKNASASLFSSSIGALGALLSAGSGSSTGEEQKGKRG